MSVKEATKRVRMTEAEVETFIKQYAKEHELTGKDLEAHLRRAAATRLAALARYSKRMIKKVVPKAKKPNKKAAKK